jgi:hypothetical protein
VSLQQAEKRRQNGRWHAYLPTHPLARPDGWVVLDRAALHDAVGEHPTCAAPSCGRELWWGSGRGLGRDPEGRHRVCVWHLDGNERNVRAENLRPLCPGCLRRNMRVPPPRRGPRGRWISRKGVANV